MQPQMTSTAWAQGFKNAIICGLGVLLVGGITTAVIASQWDIANPLAAMLAMGGIFVVTLAAFFGSWLHGRATAGQVLLDCGPHPT